MASRSRPVATPSPYSSSKGNNIEQEQLHLSVGGCIIRSLVKQLRSSSSAARSKAQHLDTMSSSSTSQDQQQQQGHDELAALKSQVKKQTRKRTHTSRPYQERLLNMAEARREIVTALRIHRANMRQQSSSKYQLEMRQQPRLQQPVAHQVMFQEQSQAFEGLPAVAMSLSYASSSSSSSSSSNSNHLCSSRLANLIAGAPPGNYNSSSSMLCYDDLAPLEEEAPGGLDQLASCGLPAQPLGLNLTFQGFGSSLDNAKISDDPFGGPLIQSSSCPARPASSYSAYSSQLMSMPGHGYSSAADAPAALSQVLDGGDGEMLYSIGGGERQGMELSDSAANVAAASAWWTKILESIESSGVGESAGAAQTTCGGEVGVMDDAVVAAAGVLPEWQWLCDGVGVEHEVASEPKPDILVQTMGLNDGDYILSPACEGDQGDKGVDMALPCLDNEGWDDEEWFI